MPTVRPEVTVVIPTRFRPELVTRAVGSVLAQTFTDFEVVVVVDGPDDDTRTALAGLGDERIRTIMLAERGGAPNARNVGARSARGRWTAMLDDDDEWLPEKLTRQVAALAANPDAEIATTGIWVVYEDKTISRVFPNGRITLTDLLKSRVMEAHPSTVIVSRAAFDRIGFVDEHIPGSYAEDYEWLLRGARETGILAIQEPLVNVHWHQSSYFSDRWKMIVDALTYLLEKVPEFEREPAGLARITGQIALAHAAAGEPALARRWARRTMRLNWKERRAYVAMAISTRLVKVETVQKLAHASGKGL
jgi:glycosyltransferase involved in cell wall biosynthesis